MASLLAQLATPQRSMSDLLQAVKLPAGPDPMSLASIGGPRMAATDITGGQSLAPADMTTAPINMASPHVKLGFFDQGGTGQHIASILGPMLGMLGDSLATQNGGQPIYSNMLKLQQQAQDSALDRRYKMAQIAELARKAGQPQTEHVGSSFGIVDPDTGGFTPTYTAPSDAENYATALGAQRGTPDWMKALQDYTLRSAGPSALDNREGFEDYAQDNRMQLEGERQRNRLSLRSVPTYGQAHPRPTAGSAGAGVRPGPAGGISTKDLLSALGGR